MSAAPREAAYRHDTSTATLIYPHQLFHDHPALARDRAAPIYLMEDPLFFTQYRFHPLKIRYHRLSMAAYRRQLESKGRTVRLVRSRELPSSGSIVSLLDPRVGKILVADLADDWLSGGLHRAARERNIAIETLRSPAFLLGRDEITEATGGGGTLRLAPFYRHMRLRHAILVDGDGGPIGGRWSFDTENRKKIPSRHQPPPPPTEIHGGEARSIARELAGTIPFAAERAPFDGEHRWDELPPYPFTRDDALEWLEEFLSRRLPLFGAYEDAIDRRDDRWYHSMLTPMLNTGILTPGETLRRTMEIAERAEGEGHPIPINSLEGFVRQILGWREFMGAAYHLGGRGMRSRNTWSHTRAMPRSFYNGTTGLAPFDRVVKKTIRLAWAH
ncbi:MAG: cryptochrome/photolyase family protein, partial [Spirochaetales bacterium]|nr:cryptochrome/photolyase family protein [Spirochaetales bacterium]